MKNKCCILCQYNAYRLLPIFKRHLPIKVRETTFLVEYFSVGTLLWCYRCVLPYCVARSFYLSVLQRLKRRINMMLVHNPPPSPHRLNICLYFLNAVPQFFLNFLKESYMKVRTSNNCWYMYKLAPLGFLRKTTASPQREHLWLSI
jgi:hypothetical protein